MVPNTFGQTDYRPGQMCSRCVGSGQITIYGLEHSKYGSYTTVKFRFCPDCSGSGRLGTTTSPLPQITITREALDKIMENPEFMQKLKDDPKFQEGFMGMLTPELQRVLRERLASIDNPVPVTPTAMPERLTPTEMVRINGGTFTMGSPANEPDRNDNEVQHQVTVSSFYMGKYEVTQKEYQEVMGTNPSNSKGDNLPVTNVSWFDVVEYCNKRSQKEGLTPAYTISGRIPATGYPITSATVTWNRNANGYRLPTEAEWEYACRAGTTTPFSTGNNITTSQANYNGNNPYNNNAKGTYRESTTPVGSFAPNAWGLYDMHGNVIEWCWDWYGDYTNMAQTDPTGASSGSGRVRRGGGWGSSAAGVRSADRSGITPSYRSIDRGFRLVRP